MTFYQVRTHLARVEVRSSHGILRWPTLSQGRAYAEGLSMGGHEANLRDRIRRREDYYPANVFPHLGD
jgi:hypothetical protein